MKIVVINGGMWFGGNMDIIVEKVVQGFDVEYIYLCKYQIQLIEDYCYI